MTIFSSMVLLIPASSRAERDPALEAEMQKISHAVLSPYCPGRLLSDCPSSAASDLKKEIYNKLDAGQSPEQVIEDLYMTFGDKIRAVPSTQGFGLFAWITPFLFLILGGGILLFWLRRHARQEATSAATVELSSEEQQKVEQFLSSNQE